MNETTSDFEVAFPPNARLAGLTFGDGEIRVTLQDGGAERIVPPSSIVAIHGASIRSEGVHPAPLPTASIVEKSLGREGVAPNEATQEVIAIRSSSVGELWYFVADSFNFRKTLGAEAGYVLDQNLRRFMKKLTSIAPKAVTDAYVTALLGGLTPPPPLESLLDFLRSASR